MQLRTLFNDSIEELRTIYEYNEAKTIAEWLLCDIFNLKNRIQLYEQFQNTANQIEIKIYKQKLKRLLRFEPIQYVIHKVWFCDLELWVNSSVLIPRPETEEMCNTIIREVTLNNADVLDIATGSGCIAIALKKKKPLWSITATDFSPYALEIGRCNAQRHNLDICFLQDDMHNSMLHKNKLLVDIMVSNPPYIPLSEKSQMHLNVIRYEPSNALFVPDEDPLIFYKAITKIAERCLKPKGYIYVEIHESLADQTKILFDSISWNTNVYKDIHGKPRYLKAWKNG